MIRPIELLIHGASGRMGQSLLRLCAEQAHCQVVAAVSHRSPAQRRVDGVPFFANVPQANTPRLSFATVPVDETEAGMRVTETFRHAERQPAHA